MAKDYYETLGIARGSSREEIKKAYKQLAKKYHPDVNKENPQAEQKFKEINEAAAILGDEEKRRQYDSLGHDAFTNASKGGGGPGAGGYDYSGFSADMDFGDIFETFFGGSFGGSGGGSSRRRNGRGADLRYDLEISLKEAAFGTRHRVSLRKRDACKKCAGTGGKRAETCTTCHGTGYVRQTRRTPFGLFQTTGQCPNCDGEGTRILEPCSACDGAGTSIESKTLEVDIPAGVDSGSRLRIAGEGEAGSRGARAGDLYIFLAVEPHELFERQGNDIFLEVPISFFQATFGAEITVPTLDGSAKLKLVAGTQSGTIFRLKGKGIAHLHGHGNGDELVKVRVVTPERLSRKQETLLRDAAKEFGDLAAPQKGLFEKLKEHLR